MGDRVWNSLEGRWEYPETIAAIKRAVEALEALQADDRMTVFHEFCLHCGAQDPGCQCWNDE